MSEALRKARTGLRVCLVRPPVITAPRSLSYYGAVPDLGLAYVAAAVREAGHQVTVIDAPGLALDSVRPWPTAVGRLARQGLDVHEIVERIPVDVDVVGFTNMFLHEWPLLRTIIAAVKRSRPRALTIVGGENASAYWATMLRECPELDVCVRGEGEATVCDLLARAEAGEPLDGTASIALRVRGSPIATARRARIVDLDALPTPAWDLFPVERYLEHRLGSGVDRGPAMPVLTSRGCPYRCTFCSSPQMWSPRYVRRDPERVLDEIEHLQRRYGVRNVNLNDLTSLLTKAWIMEFCAAVQRRGLAFTWQLPSGTRSEAVDREAAQAMHAAGCRNFCYAPESGSPAELWRMKKRVKLPALVASIEGAIEAGLVTQASIIIGMPEQERDDVVRTWRFVLSLANRGLHSLAVLVFAPYPGSEAYDQLAAEGRILHDDAYRYGSLLRSIGGAGRTYHARWSTRRLAATQLAMLATFYAAQYVRRPKRALEVVSNLARGKQETVLEKLVAAKARLVWSR